jgi:dynein heavy chain
MIFEIRDLAYATPATVSRAGIIYLSTDLGTQVCVVPSTSLVWSMMIGTTVCGVVARMVALPVPQWRSMIAAWIHSRSEPESVKMALAKFMESYIADTLLHMKKNMKALVPMEDTTIVAALLRNLQVTLRCLAVSAMLVSLPSSSPLSLLLSSSSLQ